MSLSRLINIRKHACRNIRQTKWNLIKLVSMKIVVWNFVKTTRNIRWINMFKRYTNDIINAIVYWITIIFANLNNLSYELLIWLLCPLTSTSIPIMLTCLYEQKNGLFLKLSSQWRFFLVFLFCCRVDDTYTHTHTSVQLLATNETFSSFFFKTNNEIFCEIERENKIKSCEWKRKS